MTKSKQTLVAWLRDAHAMERASVEYWDRLADRLSRFSAAGGTVSCPLAGVHRPGSGHREMPEGYRLRHFDLQRPDEPVHRIAQAYAVAVVPDEVVKDARPGCLCGPPLRDRSVYVTWGGGAVPSGARHRPDV